MKRMKGWLIAAGMALLLAACGGKTAEEASSDMEKAYKDVKTMEIKFNEKAVSPDDYDLKGTMQLDLENDLSYSEYDDEGKITKISTGKEGVTYDDGTKTEVLEGRLSDYMLFVEQYEFELHKNPIAFYEKFDSDFQEKLKLQETDSEYILTYEGSSEEAQELMRDLTENYYNGLQKAAGISEVDLSSIKGKGFEYKVTVDKKTSLVKELVRNHKYSLEINGKKQEQDVSKTHAYSYDTVDSIPTITAEAKPEATPEQEASAQEAAKYVDALIQATVYQNTDEFMKRHPEAPEQEAVKKRGDFQKSAFVEIYKSNTANNFQGLPTAVSEDQINLYTEGFLAAIKQTKYKVNGAVYNPDTDSYTVDLEIQGFSENRLLAEAVQPVMQKQQNGELTNEEFVDELITASANRFKGAVPLEPPVKASVNVIKNGEGHYEVLLQDEYLLSFVQ
ncbi:DUF6612 family protein [Metabacillus sp. SLBN-84]